MHDAIHVDQEPQPRGNRRSFTYGSTNESGSKDLFVVGHSIRF